MRDFWLFYILYMCYMITLWWPPVSFIQDVVIQTEDEIRVKIVGTRVDATDIVSKLQNLFNELFVSK